MSTITRTLRNLRKVGIKVCHSAQPPAGPSANIGPRTTLSRWWYVQRTLTTPETTANTRPPRYRTVHRYVSAIPTRASASHLTLIGDTKAGTLIGTDRAGNKFFENNEELPLRTRWVEYAKHDYDAGQIEPGWHAWISYLVDKPPVQDALLQTGTRAFEPAAPIPNLTMTRGAFKTYNT